MEGIYQTPPRSKTLSVRLTPRDKQMVRRAAEHTETSMSAFAAEAMVRRARLVLPEESADGAESRGRESRA